MLGFKSALGYKGHAQNHGAGYFQALGVVMSLPPRVALLTPEPAVPGPL